MNNEVTALVFELKALKNKIEDVFSMSYYCYGSLFYKRDDRNLFTNDWAFV